MRQDAPATDLFRDDDPKRVIAIAEKKQLPLPPFQMRKPADDVPARIRRFVGIWVSDPSWESGRQGMLIVANADLQGRTVGYHVSGPPKPTSFVKSPAAYSRFTGEIAEGKLSIVWGRSTFRVRLSTNDRVDITETFNEWPRHDWRVQACLDAHRSRTHGQTLDCAEAMHPRAMAARREPHTPSRCDSHPITALTSAIQLTALAVAAANAIILLTTD